MKGNDFFEQAAQISKANAYDIAVENIKELKEVIRQLIEVGELDDIKFTDDQDTEKFQAIVKRAKLLSIKF